MKGSEHRAVAVDAKSVCPPATLQADILQTTRLFEGLLAQLLVRTPATTRYTHFGYKLMGPRACRSISASTQNNLR